jgi:hypothetical protein
MWNKLKDAAVEMGSNAKETSGEALSSLKTQSSNLSAAASQKVVNSTRDFTVKSVSIVEEIDNGLAAAGAAFEVNSFRVVTSIGITGGATLDITFTKTAAAKAASNERRSNLEVVNPSTKQVLRIPRSAVKGKQTVKVRDPVSGEILQIDAVTGKIITVEKLSLT